MFSGYCTRSSGGRSWMGRRMGAWIMVVLVLMTVVYGRGVMRMVALRREKQSIQADIAALRLRNEKLRETAAYLASDAFVEEAARRELGMVRSGEFMYVLAEPVDRQSPLYVEKRP